MTVPGERRSLPAPVQCGPEETARREAWSLAPLELVVFAGAVLIFVLVPLLARGASAGGWEVRVAAPGAAGRTPAQSSSLVRLDLNRATAAELELLPGIGPRRAALIVERRASDGPYRSLADLRDIAGLPRATVERLMPHLYVAPERTPR